MAQAVAALCTDATMVGRSFRNANPNLLIEGSRITLVDTTSGQSKSE
jgi:hypothetical protein